MRSIAVMILHAFVTQAHIKRLSTNIMGNAQDSIDKLLDEIVDRLLIRTLKVSLPRHKELDNTRLRRPHHHTIPFQPSSPFPFSHLVPTFPLEGPLRRPLSNVAAHGLSDENAASGLVGVVNSGLLRTHNVIGDTTKVSVPKVPDSEDIETRLHTLKHLLQLSTEDLKSALADIWSPAAFIASRLPHGNMQASRRAAISLMMSTALLNAVASTPKVALAASSGGGGAERQDLLRAIETNAPDEVVLQAIKALVPLDPSSGRGAVSDSLAGTWRLLWSYKENGGGAADSPLLKLPRVIRPTSLQLVGAPATAVVGKGRVANILCFPAGIRLLLSSNGFPVPEGPPSELEISPPFRLEIDAGGGAAKLQLFDTASGIQRDGIRLYVDENQQPAPRNKYEQQYLEVANVPGDLRISKIVCCDTTIVGSVFVHERVV